MNAHQGRSRFNVSHHQSDGFFDTPVSVGTEFGAKAMDAELAPASGKIRRCELLDWVGVHSPIIAGAQAGAGDQELAYPRALNGKMASCFEAMGAPL